MNSLTLIDDCMHTVTLNFAIPNKGYCGYKKLTCPFETLGTGTSARSFKTSGPPNEETRIALIVVIAFDFQPLP